MLSLRVNISDQYIKTAQYFLKIISNLLWLTYLLNVIGVLIKK